MELTQNNLQAPEKLINESEEKAILALKLYIGEQY